jgi:hypothetical protein
MAHYTFLGMNKQIEKDNYLFCADICLILEKMIWKTDNIIYVIKQQKGRLWESYG